MADFGGNVSPSEPGNIDDTTAPTFVSAEKISDTAIEITFSELIQILGASDFVVTDDQGTAINIASATDGTALDNKIALSIPNLLAANATITITYINNDDLVRDFGANMLATDAIGITLDVIAPDAPVIASISEDLGQSGTDFITNDKTIAISASSEAGAAVEFFLDGSSIGSVTADVGGTATLDYSSTSLMEGSYELTAQATDATGNVGALSLIQTITIDQTVPTVVAINRLDPDGLDGNITAVRYEAIFSEDVYGVDVADFELSNNGSVNTSIASVSMTNQASYEIVINVSNGANGDTFGLNLNDDDSIEDTAGNILGGAGTGNGDFTGQSYSFKTPQSITFNQDLNGLIYGDSDVTLSADATSNLPVTFSATGPVSINGNTLSILGAGDASVTATQEGDGTFAAASPVTIDFTISKATLTVTADDQTITFGEALPAYSVTYSGFIGADTEADIDTAPTATSIANATSDAGTYDIVPAGGADNDYDFTYVDGTLTINKADQVITFPQLSNVDIASTNMVTLSATSDAGLDVTYSLDQGDGTISDTGILIVSNTGNFTITASQAGNTNYNAATPVSQSFQVTDSRKQDQTITFNAITDQTYGDQLTLGATASSNLAVTYTLDEGVGTITNGVLTIEGIGNYEVTASQAGDNDFNPAPSVTQTFDVTKASLII